MKTVTIQIGNSDDKLSQVRWSAFVNHTAQAISKHADEVHFHGTSPGDAVWQNAAWVCEVKETELDALKARMTAVREEFEQTSIAWTEGVTSFI